MKTTSSRKTSYPVHLSTVACQKTGNSPWLNIESAGWLNTPSAPTLHSQLSIGRQGALACGQRLLLRQGENDMACGHHCVLMALMLLGVVQRDALYDEDLDKRLNEVCAIGQSRYFTGCLISNIKEQFVPFDEQVRCRHLQRDVAARTIAALESDQVCLVRFTSPSYSHWVLAVGVMYVGEVPATLLVLDPLMDAVPLTPWNALLEHWGSKRLRNTNARWSEKAVIEKVLQVGLRTRLDKGS